PHLSYMLSFRHSWSAFFSYTPRFRSLSQGLSGVSRTIWWIGLLSVVMVGGSFWGRWRGSGWGAWLWLWEVAWALGVACLGWVNRGGGLPGCRCGLALLSRHGPRRGLSASGAGCLGWRRDSVRAP